MKEKTMKNSIVRFISSSSVAEQPSDARHNDYKSYNQTRYMKTKAADAFGMRIQLHRLRLAGGILIH